jgi:hypothetical protein
VPFLRGLGQVSIHLYGSYYANSLNSSLIGPVIGGYLANPVETLPSIFQKRKFWEIYPYLLPQLVVTSLILMSGLIGFLFLEEVHPNFQHRYDLGLEISRWVCEKFNRALGYEIARGYKVVLDSEDELQLSQIAKTEESDEAGEDEHEQPARFEDISSDFESMHSTPRSAYPAQTVLQILAVSVLAFHKVSSEVIIPMFLATPPSSTAEHPNNVNEGLLKFSAGLGMGTTSISHILLYQAIVTIIVQIFLVPRIITKFGALSSFRWATFGFPWMYCVTPFMARLPHPFSTIAILFDLWVKGVLVGLGYVCSAIL